MIDEGGVAKLTDADIVDANAERSLPPVATEITRQNLKDWVTLTQNDAAIAIHVLHSASALASVPPPPNQTLQP